MFMNVVGVGGAPWDCVCLLLYWMYLVGVGGAPWDTSNPLQALKALQQQQQHQQGGGGGASHIPENQKLLEHLHMLQQKAVAKGRLSGVVSPDMLLNDGKDQDHGPLRILLTQQEQQERASIAMAAPITQPKVCLITNYRIIIVRLGD